MNPYPHGSTAAYYWYLSDKYDIPLTAIWMCFLTQQYSAGSM